ncbi:SMAD/FHA domain-containing protein [Phyllosticta citrichinensis]|uniref:SMAD/FHA domain-containing protein n=1 Tax=Phyllosticta citrichinensis TaxID=1130410 RepID=A0ABR1Y1Y4_9PEZI
MATDSESTSRPPRSPPRRERRRSLSEERVRSRGGGRDLDEDDHRRERRRQRHSRSPDDRLRSKHSGRHRDESRDRERSHRRKRDDNKDDSRRKRSLSRSRGDRNRSRSASRDRHDRRRRHRDRSGSPTRPHRKDRTSERSVSPRSSRRSGRGGRSRSRSPKRRKPSTSLSPRPRSKRSTKPLPSQEAAYNGNGDSGPVEKPVEKEKPNFNQTGLLAREANMVEGTNIVLKYNEPADARKPPRKDDWRLFIFKGKDLLASTPLYSRSCWLFGREVKIADMVLEHPSASKQHAVLQFRYTTRTNEFGDAKSQVRPHLIDLESSNGTFLHKKRIEGSRYVELMPYDVFSFGTSEREYVLMKGDGSDK